MWIEDGMECSAASQGPYAKMICLRCLNHSNERGEAKPHSCFQNGEKRTPKPPAYNCEFRCKMDPCVSLWKRIVYQIVNSLLLEIFWGKWSDSIIKIGLNGSRMKCTVCDGNKLELRATYKESIISKSLKIDQT